MALPDSYSINKYNLATIGRTLLFLLTIVRGVLVASLCLAARTYSKPVKAVAANSSRRATSGMHYKSDLSHSGDSYLLDMHYHIS